MEKINKLKANSLFNHLAFKINISFILAWNFCFLTITGAGFLNIFIRNQNHIYYLNLILLSSLTLISVVAMSYYTDTYFCLIIVIFQIGNTVNKDLFILNAKNNETLNKNNFHLFLTCFTVVCLIGSLIKKYKESIKENGNGEIEEFKKNYEINKINKDIYKI